MSYDNPMLELIGGEAPEMPEKVMGFPVAPLDTWKNAQGHGGGGGGGTKTFATKGPGESVLPSLPVARGGTAAVLGLKGAAAVDDEFNDAALQEAQRVDANSQIGNSLAKNLLISAGLIAHHPADLRAVPDNDGRAVTQFLMRRKMAQEAAAGRAAQAAAAEQAARQKKQDERGDTEWGWKEQEHGRAEELRAAQADPDSTLSATFRSLASQAMNGPVPKLSMLELKAMLPGDIANLLEKRAEAQARLAEQRTAHGQAHADRQAAIEARKEKAAADNEPLDDAALNLAADALAKTGTMPAGLSRDKKTVRAVLARAAARHPDADLGDAKASYGADSGSLKHQQQLVDMTKSWEKTGKANLGVLRDISKELADSGSPLLNTPLRKLLEKGVGNPTVTKFKAAHAAVVNEYAKILSGATGSAGVTDAARREADSMLPLDATPAQIAAAADLLETDANNRLSALEGQLAETKGRISGKKGGGEKGDGGAPVRTFKRVNGKLVEVKG